MSTRWARLWAVAKRPLETNRWHCALVAVPSLWLGLLLWREEAVDPLTAPSLIIDRVLQGSSLLLVVAVCGVLFAERAAATSCAASFSIGTVVLATPILMTGLFRPAVNGRVMAVAVASLIAAAWIFYRFGLEVPWLGSATSKVLASTVALMLPLLQFWNTSSFLPGRTEANVTQIVTTTAAGLDGDGQVLRSLVTYKVTNDTDVRVLAIITNLTVCWWASDSARQDESGLDGDTTTSQLGTNCRVFRPIASNAWIGSKSSLAYQVALEIPLDQPLMGVKARIAYARGDRLRTSGPMKPLPEEGQCRDAEAVRVQEESRFKGLIQEDKYLVYADRDGDGGRNYAVQFTHNPSCTAGTDAELQDYFGLTEGTVIHDAWINVPAEGSSLSTPSEN